MDRLIAKTFWMIAKQGIKLRCSQDPFGLCVFGPPYNLVMARWQDLAKQVRWSKQYQDEIRERKMKPGIYLLPEAGEYFSGT